MLNKFHLARPRRRWRDQVRKDTQKRVGKDWTQKRDAYGITEKGEGCVIR
jgi:hypothetical protein